MSRQHVIASPMYDIPHSVDHPWYDAAFELVSPRFEPLAADGVHLLRYAVSAANPGRESWPLFVHGRDGQPALNPEFAAVGEREDRFGSAYLHGAACVALARGASAISVHPDSVRVSSNATRFTVPMSLRDRVDKQLRRTSTPLLELPSRPAAIGVSWERTLDPRTGGLTTRPEVGVGVWQEVPISSDPSVTVEVGAAPLGESPSRRLLTILQDGDPSARECITPITVQQLGEAMLYAATALPPTSY